jgi:hypothetical protein
MKHPTKKEVRRIEQFIEQMRWAFGLQNHDFDHDFAKEDSNSLAAKIRNQDDYQRITITIYPCFFKYSLREQREYLLHEFCHYLNESIAQTAWNLLMGKLETEEHYRWANEKSTSMTANIMDKLLDGKMKFAKIAYKKYLK